MKAIRPVHLHDTGPKVSNLHKGLLFLLLNQTGVSDNDRETIQKRLAPEIRKQTFGQATAELVGIFQKLLKGRTDLPKQLKARVQDLPISPGTDRGNGDVDEVTADGLNWVLKKSGALSRNER